MAMLDVDLVESLHVVGHERDRHDQQVAAVLCGETADEPMQGWSKPLGSADLALIADISPTVPSAAFPYQFCRSLHLALIRVTLLDHGKRYAVRTEDEVRVARIGEAG